MFEKSSCKKTHLLQSSVALLWENIHGEVARLDANLRHTALPGAVSRRVVIARRIGGVPLLHLSPLLNVRRRNADLGDQLGHALHPARLGRRLLPRALLPLAIARVLAQLDGDRLHGAQVVKLELFAPEQHVGGGGGHGLGGGARIQAAVEPDLAKVAAEGDRGQR